MAAGTLSTLIEEAGRRRAATSTDDWIDAGTLLGRRSLEVGDRCGEPTRVVSELAETAVAVEAEDAANLTGQVAVIDVLGVWSAADGADAALLRDELRNLISADPVALEEVVVTAPAVKALSRLLSSGVVTRLAIGVVAVLRAAVSREVLERLPLTTVRASLHARIVWKGCDNERLFAVQIADH
jgi:hypothetical protein